MEAERKKETQVEVGVDHLIQGRKRKIEAKVEKEKVRKMNGK